MSSLCSADKKRPNRYSPDGRTQNPGGSERPDLITAPSRIIEDASHKLYAPEAGDQISGDRSLVTFNCPLQSGTVSNYLDDIRNRHCSYLNFIDHGLK